MKLRPFFLTVMIAAMVLGISFPALAQRDRPMDDRGYYPERWVRIGVDYDNDGRIDRFEYMNIRDFERARERSMRRENGRMTEREDRMGYYGDRDRMTMGERERLYRDERSRVREMKTETGTLMNLETVNLTGVDPAGRNHMIARLRTPEGRVARVDLGPVENMDKHQLKEGDPVTVHGRLGTINEAGMLIAKRIDGPGWSVSVPAPYDRDLRRYRGEVLSARPASFREGRAPDIVLARVRLDSGAVTAVNLGPMDQFQNMDWNNLSGKEIGFLAHPARIGDRVALIADEVRLEGRTIAIDWSARRAPARPQGRLQTPPAEGGPTG